MFYIFNSLAGVSSLDVRREIAVIKSEIFRRYALTAQCEVLNHARRRCRRMSATNAYNKRLTSGSSVPFINHANLRELACRRVSSLLLPLLMRPMANEKASLAGTHTYTHSRTITPIHYCRPTFAGVAY